MPLFSTARTKASSTDPLSSSPTKPRKLFRRQGKHRPSPTSALAPINLNYYDRPEEKTGPDFFEKYRVNVVDVTSDKPSLVQTFDPPRDEPNWFLTSPPPREQNLEPPQSQPRALRGAQKPRSSSPKPPPSEPQSRAVYCQIDGNQNSERDWRPLSEEKDEDSLEGPNRDPHPLDRVNVRLLSRYLCLCVLHSLRCPRVMSHTLDRHLILTRLAEPALGSRVKTRASRSATTYKTWFTIVPSSYVAPKTTAWIPAEGGARLRNGT